MQAASPRTGPRRPAPRGSRGCPAPPRTLRKFNDDPSYILHRIAVNRRHDGESVCRHFAFSLGGVTMPSLVSQQTRCSRSGVVNVDLETARPLCGGACRRRRGMGEVFSRRAGDPGFLGDRLGAGSHRQGGSRDNGRRPTRRRRPARRASRRPSSPRPSPAPPSTTGCRRSAPAAPTTRSSSPPIPPAR